MMKEGLHIGEVHGHLELLKIDGGKPHIFDIAKSKPVWVETVMEESRLRKFRPISELELVGKYLGKIK